jgi:hypothetical protein
VAVHALRPWKVASGISPEEHWKQRDNRFPERDCGHEMPFEKRATVPRPRPPRTLTSVSMPVPELVGQKIGAVALINGWSSISVSRAPGLLRRQPDVEFNSNLVFGSDTRFSGGRDPEVGLLHGGVTGVTAVL